MKRRDLCSSELGAEWRQRDLEFVTSDAFRKLLKENNVKLITWRELGKLIAKP